MFLWRGAQRPDRATSGISLRKSCSSSGTMKRGVNSVRDVVDSCGTAGTSTERGRKAYMRTCFLFDFALPLCLFGAGWPAVVCFDLGKGIWHLVVVIV